MGNSRKYFSLLAAAGLLASGAAQATLFDRGGGLLYDDVLKVTWLQDANYAKTSGYDADGLMTWSEADAWAKSLSYGGNTGWRLAGNVPVDSGGWKYSLTYDGHSDYGYNIASPNSELGYMFYANLGLTAYFAPDGTFQPDFGVFGNGSTGGQSDVGLVKNLRSSIYWSGTEFAGNPLHFAWSFYTVDGLQEIGAKVNLYSAWAVHDGDIAAVPEPETYALFLAGLAVMGGALRRRAGKAG